MHNERLQDVELRFQCLETTNYSGVLIWKIGEYKQRKLQAASGQILSLYSQPFYTSRYGYKMCARVYLNGDGVGKGTHMSLFFVIMQVNSPVSKLSCLNVSSKAASKVTSELAVHL
jgi:hypothetical protein